MPLLRPRDLRKKVTYASEEDDDVEIQEETVRRACAASIRKLEKQTRTKIVAQNKTSKRQSKTDKRRHEIELIVHQRFMGEAVKQTVPSLSRDFLKIFDHIEDVQYLFDDDESLDPPQELRNRNKTPNQSQEILDENVMPNPIQVILDEKKTSNASQDILDENVIPNLNQGILDECESTTVSASIPCEESETTNEISSGTAVPQLTENLDDLALPQTNDMEAIYNPNDDNFDLGYDQFLDCDDHLNWESAGTEDDENLFDIVGPRGRCDYFDTEVLRERFFKFGNDYEGDEKPQQNSFTVEGFPSCAQPDADFGKCLEPSVNGDHQPIYSVTEKLAANELIRTIRAADINSFFDYVARAFSCPRGGSNGQCLSSCGCRGRWDHVYSVLTPLHFAAASSNPNFLQYMLDEDCVYQALAFRLGHSANTKGISEHYMAKIERWMTFKKKGRISPMDVAAELGLLHNLHILLNSVSFRKTISVDKGAKITTDSTCSYVSKHLVAESIMSRLVENGMWFQMSREDQYLIYSISTNEEVSHAIAVAASKGDIHFIDSMNLTQFSLTEVGEPRNEIPGKSLDSARKCIPPPSAHCIAQYGHYEAFNRMSDEAKRCTDVDHFSSLSSMFDFTDEQILKHLHLYKDVVREDAFVFVSQIIVRSRITLLDTVLSMVLSNPSYFSRPLINHPVYEEYGLPSYVPLPMETALSRQDTLTMFHKIIQIYSRFSKSPLQKLMIAEDAFRCLESIQDKACRISDQLRLALILMMMQFVNISSDRFEYILSIHLDKAEKDLVAEYVIREVRKKKKSHRGNGNMTMQWKKAMITARETVTGWDGTVEDLDSFPTFATESEKSRRAGNTVPMRSILKKRPNQSPHVENEESRLNEEMRQLASAFEKFEMGNEETGDD